MRFDHITGSLGGQWRRNEFESGGYMSGAKHRKNVFIMPVHFFDSTFTIGCFGERFRDGQYILAGFSIATRCPRARPFVKVGVGARAPPVTCGSGATTTYVVNFWEHDM